jgi:hypothetical protein
MSSMLVSPSSLGWNKLAVSAHSLEVLIFQTRTSEGTKAERLLNTVATDDSSLSLSLRGRAEVAADQRSKLILYIIVSFSCSVLVVALNGPRGGGGSESERLLNAVATDNSLSACTYRRPTKVIFVSRLSREEVLLVPILFAVRKKMY